MSLYVSVRFVLCACCSGGSFFHQLSLFLLFFSTHSGANGAGRPERENLEDYRLWAGERVAPDHQDECSGHLRLDGP